jgi:23S rRNA (cytosine1962-C5)-methyltransferase
MKKNPKIILKKNEERRIKLGHMWIFSNEIEKTEEIIENGNIVDVYSHNNNFICKAFYNKNSLIALRVLTKYQNEEIDNNFFKKRISDAFELRKLYLRNKSSFRLINGESDYIPGLIIDKYENKFSIQAFSVGIENLLSVIVSVLEDLFHPELIIAKNDFEMRTLEGLDRYEKILYQKDDISIEPFTTELDGIKYFIDLSAGQKTGFYLDQVNSRFLIRKYISSKSRVLDLFCNEGGFTLNAAMAGANKIISIDSSDIALNTAIRNSKINGFENIEFISADVFEFLRNNKSIIENSDFIINDPPSFTKSRKNLDTAMRGYIDLNKSIMKNMKNASFLFTFSCSHHIDEKTFENIITKSASESKIIIKIIEQINCSPDHPILPFMNETKYLNGLLLYIN